MDKPISAGDLVVIVKRCCIFNDYGLGVVFRVEQILPISYRTCAVCRTEWYGPWAAAEGQPAGGQIEGAPVGWLRRIPPLEEPETESHQDKEPVYARLP